MALPVGFLAARGPEILGTSGLRLPARRASTTGSGVGDDATGGQLTADWAGLERTLSLRIDPCRVHVSHGLGTVPERR